MEYVLCPIAVGRADEQRALTDLVAHAAGGRGGLFGGGTQSAGGAVDGGGCGGGSGYGPAGTTFGPGVRPGDGLVVIVY